MKKILIELKIPSWVVATHASVRYAWRSIKWIVKPPRCEGCGARMHASYYHMEYTNPDNYSRLLVENHKGKLCPSCISDEVVRTRPTKVNSLYDYEIQDTCDCCQNEETTAYKFYETDKIRLHFAMQWWNGFHICRNCIMKALSLGRIRTGVGVMDGKYMYDTGANGLRLNPKTGKVMLFRWVKW